MTETSEPAAVFVFSGKRKSGKDYVTNLLHERLAGSIILKLSGPLKEQYAKDHNLDFERLLDATEYKEKHRADMIRWGESKRNQDEGYFCRLAIESINDDSIWIVSDARRPSDIRYFQESYPDQTITVRVEADLETRKGRGFVFEEGIDDAPSECGLDSFPSWDVVVTNGGNNDTLELKLQNLLSLARKAEISK